MHARLVKQQGRSVLKPELDPLDQLIATVLSQHTSDINTDRAFAALEAAFPAWDHVMDAPVNEVADAIRSGGLADQKAPRIKAILSEITSREGVPDLSRLASLPDDEVEAYLVSLPGVGPKTAACVLVFSMGRDAFPIDVHVHRIALRLGWVTPKTTADKAHRELTPRIPPELRYELHMALIRHGREVCVARMPRCTECVLFDLCDAGSELLANGEAR